MVGEPAGVEDEACRLPSLDDEDDNVLLSCGADVAETAEILAVVQQVAVRTRHGAVLTGRLLQVGLRVQVARVRIAGLEDGVGRHRHRRRVRTARRSAIARRKWSALTADTDRVATRAGGW